MRPFHCSCGQTTRWLDEEKQRSDALLYRMLPADIAADLREGRKVRERDRLLCLFLFFVMDTRCC